MDGFVHLSGKAALFIEDFDKPEIAPSPEVIAPVFSANEVDAVRETAWSEGYSAGRQESTEHDATATCQAVAAIAEQLTAERDVASARAEKSAEAIARLLLDSLAAAFPTLCSQLGDIEVRAIAHIVLPALTQEQ